MGQRDEIDAWLAQGGLVVAASERAARAITSDFHRARQREGLTAWPAPQIFDWQRFVATAWVEHSPDARRTVEPVLLNPTQEQSLWAAIARDSQLSGATLLAGPLHRLAALSMEAHALLCAYAPRLLRAGARTGWSSDPAAFSRWLASFDEACRARNYLSPARLPIELIPMLERKTSARPPALLAGFDRLTPPQRALFAAWGEWRELAPAEQPASLHFHRVAHQQAEFDACALWAAQQLAANPAARILILTQDASTRRGELERALLRHLPAPASSPLFEFSLGLPLSQIPLPRAAHMLLRWLALPVGDQHPGSLAENELDWLLASGHACANQHETSALQAHMRALRRRGLERPEWTLNAFLRSADAGSMSLPAEWVARIERAQSRLAQANRQPQSPLYWADLVPHLLEDLAWPGARPLSSAQFQAHRRLLQAVDATGSLGFDGRRMRWSEWVSTLARTLDQTLYAPESRNAPIQIAGPAESAGLTADAIWFLGANEDNWPAAGSTHPLLPLEVQRDDGMPHATAQLDWNLAHTITQRLLRSAAEIRFSYAQQVDGVEALPSRLIVSFAGQPTPLSPELNPEFPEKPAADFVVDASRIPFPPGLLHGGAAVLTAQSQCPFKAFATARLDARSWEPAQNGLTPIQRGQLLHFVLHSIWAGPPAGIRFSSELLSKIESGLSTFVGGHVQRVFRDKLPSGVRERMPARHLALEQDRLIALIAQWLQYEATRVSFVAVETEAPAAVTIEGLELGLRLDRIDRLIDDTCLVIDYKTGDVNPKSWNSPRPDDVQLPLYATFAPEVRSNLGGLVFAKIRPEKREFAGCVVDAKSTLIAKLRGNTSLVKRPLTPEQLTGWRATIEQLARDFVAGRAEADPRAYPETCKNCGLQSVCRILDSREPVEGDEEAEEAGDE